MPRYNDEQRAEMVRLYKSGLGCDSVGKAMGCSPCTVTAALRSANEPLRPSSTRRLLHRYGKWTRSKQTNGYIAWVAWDAERQKNKFLLEHRIVMSFMLGRELRRGENVHHINGDRADNRPENLELWVTTQPAGINTCPHCGLALTA